MGMLGDNRAWISQSEFKCWTKFSFHRSSTLHRRVHFTLAANEIVRSTVIVFCSLISVFRNITAIKNRCWHWCLWNAGRNVLVRSKTIFVYKCRVWRRHFALILLPQLAQEHTQYELHALSVSHPVQWVPENSAPAQFCVVQLSPAVLSLQCSDFVFPTHSK